MHVSAYRCGNGSCVPHLPGLHRGTCAACGGVCVCVFPIRRLGGVISIHSGEISTPAQRVAPSGRRWWLAQRGRQKAVALAEFPLPPNCWLCNPFPPSPTRSVPTCLRLTHPPALALPVLAVGTGCAVSLPWFLTAVAVGGGGGGVFSRQGASDASLVGIQKRCHNAVERSASPVAVLLANFGAQRGWRGGSVAH